MDVVLEVDRRPSHVEGVLPEFELVPGPFFVQLDHAVAKHPIDLVKVLPSQVLRGGVFCFGVLISSLQELDHEEERDANGGELVGPYLFLVEDDHWVRPRFLLGVGLLDCDHEACLA